MMSEAVEQLATGQRVVALEVLGQAIAIPVSEVRDVVGPQRLTRVPGAGPEVAGVFNLRGNIVTAIDIAAALGLSADPAAARMNVVVQHGSEMYSLLVERVHEVADLTPEQMDDAQTALSERWREVAAGLGRREHDLIVLLDIGRLLGLASIS
jgi:purine-binding chemotaxis protein CheW